MKVAILGTGNIGTDLLMNVLHSPWLECQLLVGVNQHGSLISNAYETSII